MPEKCECNPCGRDAHADYQWGTSKLATQTASLCELHGQELWLMLNPLLQLNHAWLRMDRVDGIARVSKEVTTTLKKLPRIDETSGLIRYKEGKCRVCGDEEVCWYCKPYGHFGVSRLNNTTIDHYYFERPKPVWALVLAAEGWLWRGSTEKPEINDHHTGSWFTQDKGLAEQAAKAWGLELPVWEGTYSIKFFWETAEDLYRKFDEKITELKKLSEITPEPPLKTELLARKELDIKVCQGSGDSNVCRYFSQRLDDGDEPGCLKLTKYRKHIDEEVDLYLKSGGKLDELPLGDNCPGVENSSHLDPSRVRETVSEEVPRTTA